MACYNVYETVSNKPVEQDALDIGTARYIADCYKAETGLDCNVEKVELVYTTQTIDTAIARR